MYLESKLPLMNVKGLQCQHCDTEAPLFQSGLSLPYTPDNLRLPNVEGSRRGHHGLTSKIVSKYNAGWSGLPLLACGGAMVRCSSREDEGSWWIMIYV